MAKPFLYQLFEVTRAKLKLPLGVEEYDALLQLVTKGDVIQTVEELRFACEVLWIKKSIHRQAFRDLFDSQQKAELAQVLKLITQQAVTKNRQEQASNYQNQDSDPIEDPPPHPKDQNTKPTSPTEEPKPEAPIEQEQKVPVADSEVLLSIEESQEGVALREEKQLSQSILSHPYILSDAYHPINRRDMRQSWRFLRQQAPTHFTANIDLPQTIQDFAKEGFLGKVHYQRHFEDKVKLLLLVDYKGSMIAFHALAKQLIDTAHYDHKKRHTWTYFFHDVPKTHFFLTPARTQAIRKEKLLQHLSTKNTRVLIFSDAGAARGQVDLARIDDTWDFLDEIRPRVRKIAWLNPVPRTRWANTTAAEIADITPMFEASPSGFRAAIRHLRGKSA